MENYLNDEDSQNLTTSHAKEYTNYGIMENHSPKYYRINEQDNIYDYLNGDLTTKFTIGGKDIPFKIAADQLDNVSNKLYRHQYSYKDILNLDRTYNLDKRMFDYTNDKLMNEWDKINHKMEGASKKYLLGEITPNRYARFYRRYEKAADKYNGYFNNLAKNATHFNYADSINNGISVVNGKGDLYDSMTKGAWGLIGGSVLAGFAPVILPKTATVGWKILSNPIVQTIGAIDGIRNLVTDNGINKTINHFNNEEYWKGALSLAGDILDASPLIGGAKATYNAGRALYNGDKISNVAKNLVQKSDIGKILVTPEQYFNEIKMNVVDYLLDSNGKWLDKPVFGMDFVKNRRLPKKELDRIWYDVHNYNEMQKAKYGYYNNIIPFRTGTVRVPTWREQLNNVISNTHANVGSTRAGAINKNGEITLFAESLFRPNIKGTMAHEYRHDVQGKFNGLNLTSDIFSPRYSQLPIPTTVRPTSQFEEIFKLNENPNLKNAQKLLGTTKKDAWFKELTEFDAELANLREKYRVNLPWTELPINVKNKMTKWLSRRFGITPENVNSIATDLSNNAYKNGGKLCKKQ